MCEVVDRGSDTGNFKEDQLQVHTTLRCNEIDTVLEEQIVEWCVDDSVLAVHVITLLWFFHCCGPEKPVTWASCSGPWEGGLSPSLSEAAVLLSDSLQAQCLNTSIHPFFQLFSDFPEGYGMFLQFYSLLNFPLKFFYCNYFGSCHAACGVLVPWKTRDGTLAPCSGSVDS